MQNVHFTPPKLARLFNVNESTIKRWIDKGMLASSKTPGGHRRVSQSQLNVFLANFPQHQTKSYVVSKLAQKNPKIAWSDYFSLLIQNKHEQALELLQEVRLRGRSLLWQIDHIITPTLFHIGLKWNEGSIQIFEEHRMTFWIRQHLTHLRTLYKPTAAPKQQKKAILACIPKETHEIPLQIVDALLYEKGWDTSILGINISINELQKAVIATKPDLICLSATYQQPTKTYLNEVDRLAQKQSCQILIGGSLSLSNQTRIQTATSFSDLITKSKN